MVEGELYSLRPGLGGETGLYRPGKNGGEHGAGMTFGGEQGTNNKSFPTRSE